MAEKKSTGSKKTTSGKSASSKKSTGKSSAKTNVNRIVKAAKKVDTSKSFKDNKDALTDVVIASATSASRAQNKKQKKFFAIFTVILVIALLAVAVYGYFNGWFNTVIYGEAGYVNGGSVNSQTYDVAAITEQELSIHFLELGNKYVGDCVYVKAGDVDVLIDAGSRQSSAETITNYVNQYVKDNKFEYVIATHAHQDHIAGFVGTNKAKGIFETFKIDTIIDFALTNQKVKTDKGANTLYGNYLEKRNLAVSKGAKRYSAADCFNNINSASSTYQLTDNIDLEVLYIYYYEHETSDENNYSVCVMINHKISDDKVNHYFFTGDLEKEGEEKMVDYYDRADTPSLPQCVLYKAGHHGSKTSSSPALLAKLKPEYVCICTCAGTSEYTSANENQFPTQQFVDNVAPYTDSVYVTTQVDFYCDKGWSSKGTVKAMNGNIVFACANGNVTMYFSNNDLKLKDTDWFKSKRVCPDAWKDE